MLEAASFLSLYLSFALLQAASRRGLALVRTRRVSRVGLRLLALGAFVAGVWFWSRAAGTTEALLVAVSALGAVATLVVLLSPVFPASVWKLALVCPPLILALAVFGAGR
jgi:hypothetical protein